MFLPNKWPLAAEEGLHAVDYVYYGMPRVAYYACANPHDWSFN